MIKNCFDVIVNLDIYRIKVMDFSWFGWCFIYSVLQVISIEFKANEESRRKGLPVFIMYNNMSAGVGGVGRGSDRTLWCTTLTKFKNYHNLGCIIVVFDACLKIIY